MSKSIEDKIAAIIVAAIVAVILLIAFAQPYFEARTFNKFSKTKATYWDALFADLRVMPDGRQSDKETSK